MLLMKSITQELAPQRIRVNSLSPGAIRTPMNLEKLTTPESCETLLSLIPCKRIGEAEDVGRAAVWLTSDDSDYVHGGGYCTSPERWCCTRSSPAGGRFGSRFDIVLTLPGEPR